MEHSLSSDSTTDFHTAEQIQKQKCTLSKVLQLATEYGVSIAFERLWAVPSILSFATIRLTSFAIIIFGG